MGIRSPLSLTYDFHLGSGDNGNVFGVANNKPGASGRSVEYSYDYLNRIASYTTQATTGSQCWGDTYTIDAWGNLTNKNKNQTAAVAPTIR